MYLSDYDYDDVDNSVTQEILEASTDRRSVGVRVRDEIQSAFDFKVVKKRFLTMDDPQLGLSFSESDRYGLYRSDTNAHIPGTAVSNSYSCHQTADIVRPAVAIAELFEDDGLEVRCHWRAGHVGALAPTKEAWKVSITEKDVIQPRAILSAGYNGLPYTLQVGLLRPLCTNLAVFQSIDTACFKFKHTLKLHERLDGFNQELEQLREGWRATILRCQQYENTRVWLRPVLEETIGRKFDIDAMSNQEIDRYMKTWNGIVNRIRREAEISQRDQQEVICPHRELVTKRDTQVTAWQAYQGIQGWYQHDAGRQNRENLKGNEWRFRRALQNLSDKRVSRAERVLNRWVLEASA